MTWYLDPDTLDVYDHTGEVVGSANSVSLPNEVHRVMQDMQDDDKPSEYNESMILDAATNNIELGTPDGHPNG